MSAIVESTMESEKAAIKRTMAHEARFREEKQRIVESLGGSRVELVTSSGDARIQRKLMKESISTDHSSTSSFQASDDHPEQEPALTDDLPIALVHLEEQNTPYTRQARRRGTRLNKNACFILAAVVLAVAIGGIVGVIVAFVNRAAASPSGSDTTRTPEKCKLDRDVLSQCENGVLAIPDCAVDTYAELIDTYAGLLVDAEQECDAAHQAMVALAVSQTNYGEDVEDPIMFFAMSVLYFTLEGTHWQADRNWLKGSSPCSGFWYGIECSPDGSAITISLENNRLQGFLPSELGLLSNLKELSIGLNGVSGPLPSEIGHLAKLQILDFHLTSIHSELPSEIGMLEELTTFKIDSAPLTGTIPSEIGNMIKLVELELIANQFIGTLPTELGKLVQLRKLRLAMLSGGITGTIPSDLVALTMLTHCGLLLYGMDRAPFPEVITMATNLEELDIRDTGFAGSLPSIAHLSHLQKLSLRFLEIEGTIPTEIGLLSDLVSVSLYHLNLQGTIPSEVGLLTNLSKLEITEEPSLTGTLPSELGSLTTIEVLDVDDTGLIGTIPREVCALNLPAGALRFDDCGNYPADHQNACMSNTCGDGRVLR